MTQYMLILLVLQTVTGYTVSQTIASQVSSPPIRLVGSDNRCSGRVEVFLEGLWGTVCDDLWDLDNAQVVCQQLGCGKPISAPNRAIFGPGIGPIWLDDVQCSGNELLITDCTHQGFGLHNCVHDEDASVYCTGDEVHTTSGPIPSVRLVGTNSSCAGRVEILYEEEWGTVCDDIWGMAHAEVVCRQLGCGRAVSALERAAFGQGTGPIWLVNDQCLGNETSIADCAHQGLWDHNCGHFKDASIICEGDGHGSIYIPTRSPSPPNLPVRLVGSNNSCSGRVEIFYENMWWTVCDDVGEYAHAQVVCRQLGCGKAVRVPQNAAFGPGTGPVWMSDVYCTGNERSLAECEYLGFRSYSCGHEDDVSVICEGDGNNVTQNITSPSLPVRLVGSNSSCSGRVEVFYNDTWGTVCDDIWELTHAQVVCLQLGCGRARTALQNAAFGEGTGPIWLDNVRCFGNESTLSQCSHPGFGSHNCGHGEDASIICEGDEVHTTSGPIPSVRLVGTNSSCSGRVEIFYNGQWGTVCDDLWGVSHAQVVCRQLGCGRAVSALERAAFGLGTGPIWLDDVQCSGNESSLTDCAHRGFGSHNCGNTEDASVICEERHNNTPNSTSPSLPVRLVGSNSSCSGRVEVFYNDTWGTVCDDIWGLTHAQVVCLQLGCGRARTALQNAAFGEGTGPIWLDNVRCFGNESTLSQCSHPGFGRHNCGHGEDASIICEGDEVHTTSGPIPSVRLVGTNSSCSGRVEIFYNGQWGTVCDDLWGVSHAQVVCRQLGCGRAVSALERAAFGQGTGPIWLDNVQCSGNESSLTDCAHRGFGSHNCGHAEDASVICEERHNNTPNSTSPSLPVRLVGSNSSCSGRVEVFYNDTWGTVCDDIWGLTHAQVVCLQLGCGRARTALQNAAFGEGTGPIWLDNVRCFGNESTLSQCSHPGFGSHNCGHGEDASIICEGDEVHTTSGPIPSVRLVGTNSSCSGRVEIFYNGQWGTVCDDLWGVSHAQVVCRQLGCGRAVSALERAAFGQGTGPIWLDNVQCSGNESSLTDCAHRGFGSHNCGHAEDASVICEERHNNTPNSTSPSLPVRLVGSNSSCSGRVEVFYNDTWGTVCDDIWGLTHAQVVCLQLGCGRARTALQNAAFGEGTGPIWLDNVRCFGNESTLSQCSHPGFGSHNCGHGEDASIICEGDEVHTTSGPIPSVRLVGTNSSCSGRVEIFYNGQWGTVCDDLWRVSHAQVVCRQLGCGRAVSALERAAFGQGTGPIWLDNVQCSGNESSLTDCAHRGFGSHNCGHAEDASVICEERHNNTQNSTTPSLPVRLVGSNSSCSGRVEVFYYGQWGTVCDDIWNMTHAQVICRQLGCGETVSAPRNAHFGEGTGPIWLDDVQCSGRESFLRHCRHPGFGSHNCGHREDASVICKGKDNDREITATPSSPVRLVGSNSRCSGRVEILFDNQWGTVCDDIWELTHAQVVCRQLACGRAVSAPRQAQFGEGTGPIWLDNVQCSGNESSITNCAHPPFGSHNCGHSEDVSVICEDEHSLLQVSQLVCSRDQLQVGVPLRSLRSAGLNIFSAHMADPSCSSYRVDQNILWYQVARQPGICGTMMMTNSTHAIYFNSLFFYPRNNESSSQAVVIPFSCAYPLETKADLNVLKPELLVRGLSESGPKAPAYMNLYRDFSFTRSYPPGLATLPPGSPLYVGVFVNESDSGFAAILENCYTTDSLDPHDTGHHFLINNRCPIDPLHVRMVENGISLSARFSAVMDTVQGFSPYIFLHCGISLCDKRSENCVPFCRGRVRRSVHTSTQLTPLTIGPITWEK